MITATVSNANIRVDRLVSFFLRTLVVALSACALLACSALQPRFSIEQERATALQGKIADVVVEKGRPYEIGEVDLNDNINDDRSELRDAIYTTLQASILESVNISGLSDIGHTRGLRLTASILALHNDGPEMTFGAFTVKARVRYTLTDIKTGDVYFRETLDLNAQTPDDESSFAGYKRYQAAKWAALSRNASAALALLSDRLGAKPLVAIAVPEPVVENDAKYSQEGRSQRGSRASASKALKQQLQKLQMQRNAMAVTGADTRAVDAAIAGVEAQLTGGDGTSAALSAYAQALPSQTQSSSPARSGGAGPSETCDGYAIQTVGDGPAGTVCRCSYGPDGELNWWAVTPGISGSTLRCDVPGSGASARTSKASASPYEIKSPAALDARTSAPNSPATIGGMQGNTTDTIVQTQCLKLSKEAWVGGISTDTTSLINQCNYRVSYIYCVSSGGRGAFSCSDQKFGAGSVGANEENSISVAGADPQFRVHWVECANKARPDERVLTIRARYADSQIFASCM